MVGKTVGHIKIGLCGNLYIVHQAEADGANAVVRSLYLVFPVLQYLLPLLRLPPALLLLPQLVDAVEEVGLVVVDSRDLVLELARLLPLLVSFGLVRLQLLEERP